MRCDGDLNSRFLWVAGGFANGFSRWFTGALSSHVGVLFSEFYFSFLCRNIDLLLFFRLID